VVLGHEGAGVVEEVGAGVTNVTPGDHVILTFVPNCGNCFHCIRGEAYLCTALPAGGRQLDGTTRLHWNGKDAGAFTALGCMAEYAVVPSISVVKIPKQVPLRAAALIGCGVTTGVGAAIKTAAVKPGSTVAVFGCGGVGLAVIQGARIAGAERIIAVDLAANKLDMALKFGATDTVDSSGQDASAKVRELTGGFGADYTFEAIGVPAVIETAYRATRRGGTLTVVGVGRFSDKVGFNALLLSLEGKTICGCMYGSVNPREDFPKLLHLFERGKLDLEGMVTRTYTIDQAPQAFADMQAGLNARGVIVFS
jgi:S-(hydroxymethyl)glutathione dehydrogenase/alcohol dehydrogenase